MEGHSVNKTPAAAYSSSTAVPQDKGKTWPCWTWQPSPVKGKGFTGTKHSSFTISLSPLLGLKLQSKMWGVKEKPQSSASPKSQLRAHHMKCRPIPSGSIASCSSSGKFTNSVEEGPLKNHQQLQNQVLNELKESLKTALMPGGISLQRDLGIKIRYMLFSSMKHTKLVFSKNCKFVWTAQERLIKDWFVAICHSLTCLTYLALKLESDFESLKLFSIFWHNSTSCCCLLGWHSPGKIHPCGESWLKGASTAGTHSFRCTQTHSAGYSTPG